MTYSKSVNILPITLAVPDKLETATLAMGCFWSPDALFGTVEGVVRTRVGYTGGTTESPTYHTMADHIETLQLDYDPCRITFQQLLRVFFSNHNPTREPWKRQYMSAVFCHTPDQEEQAFTAKEQLEASMGRQLHTAIYNYKKFYLAEDRHQKYKLQRQPEILAAFQELYPDMAGLINATAAARVNGYLYGYGKRDNLLRDIHSFGLTPAAQGVLLQKAEERRSIRCGG